MPQPSANTDPYYKLVHKLIKSTTEDEIMSTIKHLMENHDTYSDIIINHYADQNLRAIQKLYFNAIKRFNDAMRNNNDADSVVLEAEELLEQYNYFKDALGEDFMPDHDNIPIKELADAYLHSLVETVPLSDYQLFRLAKSFNNQSPENKVAEMVMQDFNDNPPTPLTAILHHIFILLNALTEMKVKLLVGNYTLPSSTINEIFAGLQSQKEEQKQLSFFKKKTDKASTRELSLHTYNEAIKQLDKDINQLEHMLKTRLTADSDNIGDQIANLSQELFQTHEKLQREKAEIAAFHYKKI